MLEDGDGWIGWVDVADGLKANGISGEGGLGAFVMSGGAVDTFDLCASVFLAVELVNVADVDSMGDIGVWRRAFAADRAGGDGTRCSSPGAGFFSTRVGAPENPSEG